MSYGITMLRQIIVQVISPASNDLTIPEHQNFDAPSAFTQERDALNMIHHTSWISSAERNLLESG